MACLEIVPKAMGLWCEVDNGFAESFASVPILGGTV